MIIASIVKQILVDPDSFATTLLLLAVDRYQADCLQWSPTNLLMELQDDFDIELPQGNLDKLNAAIAIVTTDRFYTSLPDFIDICNALSGTPLNLDMFDPADSYEMAWAIVEASILWPEALKTGFDPKIVGYIEKTLEEEGMIKSPKILSAIVPTYKLNVDSSMFDEDPGLYASVYQTQESKATDVDQSVTEALKQMTGQLDRLNLLNADAFQVIMTILREHN